MNRILLLGKNGRIGRELLRTLAPLGELTAPDLVDLDLAHPTRLRDLISEVSPSLI
ncbi:MAG: dTDP-4-dehydrorhamnose reductase, partial [Acidobacteria bacterium]|nr:dTDP-4-dehydrorhamnose reductase [Acidobacteriota bacterium]